MNILITCGATKESIDKIRFITNFSTGKTGKVISSCLNNLGHKVTVLKPKDSPISFDVKTDDFVNFCDLDQKIKFYLGKFHFDCVIQMAAISDFKVDFIEQDGKKIKPSKLKTSDKLLLGLRANPKILPKLKIYSKNPNIVVVGFKLEVSGDFLSLENFPADIVVQNNFEDIDDYKHKAKIYFKDKTFSVNTKLELAKKLETLIKASI